MTTTKLRYDPEYLAAVSAAGGLHKPEPPKDVWELRTFADNLMRSVFNSQPAPETVLETTIPFASHDGQEVNLVRFATSEMVDAAEPQPAVVYVHGGGMVACDVDIYAPQMKRLVELAGMPFFAVDFRPAPEFPDGLGVEDVYFGLKHLSEHPAQWNVDPARLVVMGDSGGGGVAAGATLMARDRRLSPPVGGQVLLYPMLDDRTLTEPQDAALDEFLTWTATNNRIAWRAVLGEKAGDPEVEGVSIYAAPGRAAVEELRGLPPTYVEIGTLDLFRDECVDFVARLVKAGVEVEFHLWPGLPHGYEGFGTISWVRRALEARRAALRRV